MKIILVVISLLLVSCTTYRKIYQTDAQNIQLISKTPILQRPQIAELQIDTNKISGTMAFKVSDPPTDAELKQAEQAVTFDVLKRTKNDLIVHPVYEIDQQGTNLNITVTGFPAKYKSFKPVTQEDLKLIETIKTSSEVKVVEFSNYHEQVPVATKKRSTSKVVLATILTVSLVFILAVGIGSLSK